MNSHLSDDELAQKFGRTRSELIQIANHHTLTVQGWLSSRSPQAVRFEGRGIKASSTGFNIPLLNLALGCDFHDESEEQIEEEVKAVIEFFAKRNVPWYWWMNSQPSPAHIGQILKRCGLEYDAPPLPAMIAPLSQSESSFPKNDKSIQVWRAKNLEDLKAASKIRRLAFKFPEGEAVSYFEDMASDWLEDSSPARLFLAGRDESQPVSIGAMIEGAGIPGVYVMATLPDHHRQGYGKAILTRFLLEASSNKSKIIALTASEMGFPLYAQFGFVHLFDFDFYSFP